MQAKKKKKKNKGAALLAAALVNDLATSDALSTQGPYAHPGVLPSDDALPPLPSLEALRASEKALCLMQQARTVCRYDIDTGYSPTAARCF